MVYLRNISDEELFSAQLELLMQHGRVASMSANLIGAAILMAVLWPYFEPSLLLIWGFGLLTLLLLRSLYMSSALADRRFLHKPKRVFWTLVFGSALTGAVWSSSFILTEAVLPSSLQYVFLLIIVMISAVSLALMVVVREYFLAFVFSAIWPIAWWMLANFWEQPQNIAIGLLLLAVTGLLVFASNGIHTTFRRMLRLNWQQETMARELGNITNSLRERNRQLQEARRQLTDLANVDELTGLGNRRLVNRALRDELRRAQRAEVWLSIILFDVDHFKKYNDHYGHPAGDEVLRRIGDVMRRLSARAGEVVARYGGEEFIMVLPRSDAEDARRMAERLQRAIRAEAMPHATSGVTAHVTVSQGVVSVQPDSDTDPATLVQRADAALYQAKNRGRNCFVLDCD